MQTKINKWSKQMRRTKGYLGALAIPALTLNGRDKALAGQARDLVKFWPYVLLIPWCSTHQEENRTHLACWYDLQMCPFSQIGGE